MQQLPDFIARAIEDRNTSLGDNAVFMDNTTPLTRSLIESRNGQVMSSISDVLGYIPTTNEAKSRLSRLITKAMKIESTIKDQLETLCESTVNQTLGVPQETVILNCELVSRITPYMTLRITPDDYEYTPQDKDLDMGMEIMKRRVIDSLVQGISYLLMTATYDNNKLGEWSPELPNLYREIIALNDYLLFSEEEDITDKTPMLGAYVETDIGKDGEKTVINSQGLVYPFLLQETYRGFFELFATHGLPSITSDAMYIIRKCDFTKAEAWDLRIGVPLWQEIDMRLKDDIEPSIYPYLFSSIAELGYDEFNRFMNGIMRGSNEPDIYMDSVIKDIMHDREYQLFKNDIEKFNLEKCLVVEDNE